MGTHTQIARFTMSPRSPDISVAHPHDAARERALLQTLMRLCLHRQSPCGRHRSPASPNAAKGVAAERLRTQSPLPFPSDLDPRSPRRVANHPHEAVQLDLNHQRSAEPLRYRASPPRVRPNSSPGERDGESGGEKRPHLNHEAVQKSQVEGGGSPLHKFVVKKRRYALSGRDSPRAPNLRLILPEDPPICSQVSPNSPLPPLDAVLVLSSPSSSGLGLAEAGLNEEEVEAAQVLVGTEVIRIR